MPVSIQSSFYTILESVIFLEPCWIACCASSATFSGFPLLVEETPPSLPFCLRTPQPSPGHLPDLLQHLHYIPKLLPFPFAPLLMSFLYIKCVLPVSISFHLTGNVTIPSSFALIFLCKVSEPRTEFYRSLKLLQSLAVNELMNLEVFGVLSVSSSLESTEFSHEPSGLPCTILRTRIGDT